MKNAFNIICFITIFLVVVIVLWGGYLIVSIGMVQSPFEETYLFSSLSPDEKITLEVYRTEPGATVDFSIKVYVVEDDSKKLIYNAYRESHATVEWISNYVVCINEKTLDLSRNETYDWRTDRTG